MNPFVGALLNGVGVVGVVLAGGWLVVTGRLVPRRTYEDKVHEAGEWRTESRIKDQQNQELSDQNNLLLNQIGPTLTKFLTDMRRFADEIRQSKDVG